MRSAHFFAALVSVGLVPSCGGAAANDSCTPPAFDGAAVTGGLQASPDGDFVVIAWSPSKNELPDAYFAKAAVTDPAASALVGSIQLERSHALRITFHAFDVYLQSHADLTLPVSVPDPRDFDACAHPGEADSYAFTVHLAFDAQKQLASSSVSPITRTSLGAI